MRIAAASGLGGAADKRYLLDRNMSRVFLRQHLHIFNIDEEDVKTLGIYYTRNAALEAVERFRALPGFKDCPQFANSSAPGPAEGFSIDEYELDQDSWSEGNPPNLARHPL